MSTTPTTTLPHLPLLRQLWAQVLGEDEDFIKDQDVFFDLGGDSLSASELVDVAEERGLIFTIEDLFNNPDLTSLASCVKTTSSQTSNSSQSPTILDSGSDDLSSSDRTDLNTDISSPPPGFSHDSWALTPRQKQLIVEGGGFPLRNPPTCRRVQLEIEAPLARIQQAFHDIVKAQLACRARLDHEAKDTFTAEKDVDDVSSQYRFRHSMYCNLSDKAIRSIEREALDSINPDDGPVFSVDVYRSEEGPCIFLAASSLFLDESSWDIILDDFDRAMSERSHPNSPSHEIWELSDLDSPMTDSPAGSPTMGGLLDEHDGGFWGIDWREYHPNTSVQSAAENPLEFAAEDAVLHVLQTFGAKFGRFVATIVLEKFRPKGLEHTVGNFEELPLTWVFEEAEAEAELSSDINGSRWIALRQHIRKALHETCWVKANQLEFFSPRPSTTELPNLPDLSVHVRLVDERLRAQGEYEVISNVLSPHDKPQDFPSTPPMAFVELDLCLSVQEPPRSVCVFDDRNRQVEGLRAWAEGFWNDPHHPTKGLSGRLEEEEKGDEFKNHLSQSQAATSTQPRISNDGWRTLAAQCDVAMDQIETVYPCSPMQESLAIEVDGDVNPYVMQLVFKMADDSSSTMARFQAAWEDTALANAVLRTRICQLAGSTTYSQAVLAETLHWQHVEDDLQTFLHHDINNPMNLGSPRFRYTILDECKNSHGHRHRYFIWTVHHALCDGASILMILEEVAKRFHREKVRDRKPFENFIHSSTIHPNPEEERTFWHHALSELDPTPYPPVPPSSAEFRPAPTSVLKQTLTLNRVPPYGITKALFLRGVWTILMSHYTGTEDVCFGAVNSGRTGRVSGVAHMTGPTINVAPVAVHIDPQEAISSFFSRFRARAAEMMPFEHSGVSKIRKILADGRHDTTAADFQTLFVVHAEDVNLALEPMCKKLGIEYLGDVGRREQHPYPLVLSLTLSPSSSSTSSLATMIELQVQYDERVMATQQAETLVHHFQKLLTDLSEASPDTLLGSISPLSDFDMAQIAKWNSFTPPVEATTVDELFHQRVVEHPEAVAVCSTTESLTYSQVAAHSSSLAQQLMDDHGVQPGQFVGVCFEKSIWTVVAIMAVFKAGAIYVPIDPGHPPGRIIEVVRTIDLQVALASPSGAEVLTGVCPRVIIVDGAPPSSSSSSSLSSRSTPAGVAYLLFTSGSTGKPKGILISHAAICTSIKHHGVAFGAGPHWRTLQFCAHTFDMSIGEFLTTLAYGGCICVPSEEERMSDLAGAITALQANTMLVVPTVANLLRPQEVPTLQTLVLGGEPVTRETVARWAAHVALTCSYGPSETAVWCAANARVAPDADPANIGRSIGGTMWIADPEDPERLAAVGCVGEIVVSGAIVGQGYVADPATTAAAFVPAPRWLQQLDPGSKGATVYRSGDLARYNVDGTLRIVGRLHTQVKLRGFRIELGEIENQMMATGAVTAALAALPRQGPCADQIVAVVSCARLGLEDHSRGGGMMTLVAPDRRRVVVDRLRAHLEHVLPHYMVPTVVVVVARLPLLISGKIDRKAIQSWIQAMDTATYDSLTQHDDDNSTSDNNDNKTIVPGSVADMLRRLWSDVLATAPDRIGLHTRFTAVGGDSLAAMRVASQAKALGLAVTARSMVGSPPITLGRLVSLVEDANAAAATDNNIDWAAETAPPELVASPHNVQHTQQQQQQQQQQQEDESSDNTPGLVILLTGATGFFGRAIVRVLQAHPAVATIHCLAVRNTTSAAAQQLARACPKAQLHPGDLSQPRLGLPSEEDARRLFAGADAVIHNGADVSFLKGYEALRSANVHSTRELIRLGAQYGRAATVPSMHYVSGTGVAALALVPPSTDNNNDDNNLLVTTDGIIQPCSLSSRQPPLPIGPVAVSPGKLVNIDGYVASKWASEVLVERSAAAALTTHASIYRLSNVTGPDAPEMDLMHNLLTKSRAMKAVPRLTTWSGRFDFIQVDTAAEALVERLVRFTRTPPSQPPTTTATTTTAVDFVHLSGEHLVPIQDLKHHLERETGGSETFEELDLETWLARAAANFHLPEPVRVFLSTLVSGDSGPFLPSVQSSIF